MKRKASRSVYILPLATIFILGCIYSGIRVFFDLNDYKDRIEFAVSSITNSDVHIHGNLDYSLFPPYFTVEKLEMTKRDSSLFYAENLIIYPSITSLLLLELRFKEIKAEEFNLELVKTSSGLFKFADSSESILEMPNLPEKTPILNLHLSRGNLSFTNKFTKDTIKLSNINGKIEGITLDNKKGVGLLGNLSFVSNFIAESSSYNWVKLDRSEIISECIDGEMKIEVNNLKNINEDELFIIILDFTKQKYYYKVNYVRNNYLFSELLEKVSINNRTSTAISISALDTATQNLTANLSGKIITKSKTVNISNFNLDSLIYHGSKQRLSEETILWSLFLHGKFGSKLLQPYKLYEPTDSKAKKSTQIKNLIANWELQDGIIMPIDVGFTTEKYSCNITGSINLISREFANLSLSINDSSDSKVYSQTLNGKFEECYITNE